MYPCEDWWVPDTLWSCVWSFLFLHLGGLLRMKIKFWGRNLLPKSLQTQGPEHFRCLLMNHCLFHSTVGMIWIAD